MVGRAFQIGGIVNIKVGDKQLLDWAKKGAFARLEELRQEDEAIRRHFPELYSTNGHTRANGAPSGTTEIRPKKKRKRMSKERRKSISVRMTKHWAGKRAGK